MKIQHQKEIIYHDLGSAIQLTEQKDVVTNSVVLFDSETNQTRPLHVETFTARPLSSRTDADKI